MISTNGLIMRRAELVGHKAFLEDHEERVALTDREKRQLLEIREEINELDSKIPEARSNGTFVKVRAKRGEKHNDRVEGRVGELLDSKTSATAWVDRAAANGVQVRSLHSGTPQRMYDSSFDTNEYWGQRFGFHKRGAETRALGEDTVGSGAAITPQTWTATFIDYLYANSLLGDLGASKVMMPTEQVNIPQFTAPVQPQWVAENTATTIDGNPAFSTLPLLAKGMFYDVTLYSMEMAQDAYVSGGLPGMLAQSAARNFAIAVDQAGFYGITGNPGCPGFMNETGVQIRKYGSGGAGNPAHTGTAGVTVADSQEYSTIAELVRAKNVEPTGFAMGPQLWGTINRTNASTYAKYWDMPADVPSKVVYSTQIPVTETDPTSGAPVQTGGSYSSMYCADWARVLIGVHLDLQTQVLSERYADQLQIGLLTFMRFSVRLSHPEAFVRSVGATAV